MRSHTPCPRRHGSTIVEVLLATTLFAMGMAALLQLIHRGSQTALRGELEAIAACRCDSIVSMILTQGEEAIPEIKQAMNRDPQWEVAISTTPHSTGLSQLTVVMRSRFAPNVGEFELTRLIDPQGANMGASRVSATRVSELGGQP